MVFTKEELSLLIANTGAVFFKEPTPNKSEVYLPILKKLLEDAYEHDTGGNKDTYYSMLYQMGIGRENVFLADPEKNDIIVELIKLYAEQVERFELDRILDTKLSEMTGREFSKLLEHIGLIK